MAECGQTILVTGVEGMIGHAVAAILRQKGCGVVGMDRRIRDAAALGVPVYEADLADAHALYGALADHPCRAIIHCGAISGPMLAPDNPAWCFRPTRRERSISSRRRGACSCGALSSPPPSWPMAAMTGRPCTRTARSWRATPTGRARLPRRQWSTPMLGSTGWRASARLAWVYGPRRRPRAPCAPCSGTP